MAKTRFLKLECTQETDGFTLGKSYECLGFSSGYVEVVDNLGERQIMKDVYFKKIGKK